MIQHIQKKEELKRFIKPVEAIFKKCFGAPPWREVFNGNLYGYFQEIINYAENISLLCFQDKRLVGASFSFPLEHKSDLQIFATKEGVEIQKTVYLAEIFIDPEFQGRGYGKALHQERLKIAKEMGFKFALQRTSPASRMFNLILHTGFKQVAGMEVESLKKIDGHEIFSPDARVISLKRL